MLAPHPDDEALATAGLLQRAAKAGAAVRVIFLTDGDKNPWPQRVIERRWRTSGSVARARWGALRRGEALASLRTLGLGPEVAEFWSLPDQGLTNLLLTQGASLLAQLNRAITGWRPTLLAATSANDRHPDHSALGVATALALRQRVRSGEATPEVLAYLVHGPTPEHSANLALQLSQAEITTKRHAILCHRSQILLSRRRFLGHATPREVFAPETVLPCENHPLRFARCDLAGLDLDVRSSSLVRLVAGGELHVLVVSGADELRHRRLSLPRLANGRALSLSTLVAPSSNPSVFVKLQRGPWLYDTAGWLELEVDLLRPTPAAARLQSAPAQVAP